MASAVWPMSPHVCACCVAAPPGGPRPVACLTWRWPRICAKRSWPVQDVPGFASFASLPSFAPDNRCNPMQSDATTCIANDAHKEAMTQAITDVTQKPGPPRLARDGAIPPKPGRCRTVSGATGPFRRCPARRRAGMAADTGVVRLALSVSSEE